MRGGWRIGSGKIKRETKMNLSKPLGVGSLLVIAALLNFAGKSLRADSPHPGPSGYHIAKTIPVTGEGGWDYLIVDADARRLYFSHSTRVLVFDADNYTQVGEIPDTQGVHGIALAPELGHGFTSNGRANTVTIFDLKTLKTLGSAKAGINPDAIIYDGVTKRVFAFNGRSKDATVINAADSSIVGTFAIGGKPEFAVSDGKGSVYVNVEDTSELLHIDAQKMSVLHRWPLAPCKEPSGLAMDLKTRRLYSVCDNEMMAVVDADSGKIIATPKIGEGPDAAAFDPTANYVFSSNGESGTLTVIHEDAPDNYSLVENVATKKGARTMALDLKNHNIFLPTAEMIPPAAGQKWPSVKPGTLEFLLLSKQSR
jgi:DNA-binding beta-propeller fold protein YncE